MTGTILSGMLGILFLAGAVMQYRCRGPIWSAEYIASSAKERRRLRTKGAYYVSGTACLLIGLSLILVMIYSLTEIAGFIYGVCVLAVLLFVLLVLGAVSAARKSTERGQDFVMRRENLDDVFPDEIEEEFRRRRRERRRRTAPGQNSRTISGSKRRRSSVSKRQQISAPEQQHISVLQQGRPSVPKRQRASDLKRESTSAQRAKRTSITEKRRTKE